MPTSVPSRSRGWRFERHFEPLLELKQSARDLDASWLRSSLWGEVFPEVDRVVHSWVHELGRSYERDSRASQDSGLPFQELMYRRLFTKEEILCKPCTENLDYRGRGRVLYPWDQLAGRSFALEILVSRMDGKDVYPLFVPTTPEEYPVPGTYRLQVWQEGASAPERETTFLVEQGWPKELRVVLAEPREDLWRDAVELGFSRLVLPLDGAVLLVPAHRVSLRTVTLAEFLAFERATGVRGDPVTFNRHDPRPADVPAMADFASAMLYAQWVGGRLPFCHELLMAHDSGALRLGAEEGIGGELVQDLFFGDSGDHGWLNYSRLRELGNISKMGLVVDARRAFAMPRADGAGFLGVGFRVSFSCDRPDTYRALATSPLASSR